MSIPLPQEAYSFDDVLLLPGYSDILPKDCDTKTRLTRDLTLNIPVISAASVPRPVSYTHLTLPTIYSV